jgi:hypothetical protein
LTFISTEIGGLLEAKHCCDVYENIALFAGNNLRNLKLNITGMAP